MTASVVRLADTSELTSFDEFDDVVKRARDRATDDPDFKPNKTVIIQLDVSSRRYRQKTDSGGLTTSEIIALLEVVKFFLLQECSTPVPE